MQHLQHLIIGNSAAGLFAAEEIRRYDQESRITILTKELYPSYSRCLMTYYLAGDISQSQLHLRDPENFKRLNLHQEFLAEVVSIKPAWKKVMTRDGREWRYDRLLIATGGQPVSLEVPGSDLPQVFTLRTMDDALQIEKRIDTGKRAVVIGGGLVSLKSAYALLKRGLKVTVVVSSRQILSQMLDSTSAQLLAQHLREYGLQIIFGTEVKAILGRESVQGVELSDHQILWADLVLIGKGVRPNLQPFLKSGIESHQGICVNEFQETNLPDIYAAGDVAETWDCVRESFRVNATWPNATQQGQIAGANMAGQRKKYPGSMSLNSVDFFGLSAISAGIVMPPTSEASGDLTREVMMNSEKKEEQKSEGATEKEWWLEENLKYRGDGLPVFERYVYRGNVLKGYVLLGDTSQAGVLTHALREARLVQGKPLRKRFLIP